ncbi:hypothetical protein LMG29542_02309 [Paraburkholderia humisilvae]|uniref:Uncharacterized protein n=1 Tax=Paraburkholderia humisilvae TaxID=627669 RepID=A0A6J5DMT4_9BURK|nr:hypothetical protein LMG29542_02309 [Paraburkholderia humisilvae]
MPNAPKNALKGWTTDQARHRQLARIESTIRLSRQLARHPIRPGPAAQAGIFSGGMCYVLVNALEASLDHTRWHIGGHLGVVISTATALLAGVVVYRRWPYKTYSKKVSGMLAAYEPLDVDAFRAIQAVAESGSLGSEEILEWITREREEIRRRSAQTEALSRDPATRLPFLRKRP